jgi:hypothetical protein
VPSRGKLNIHNDQMTHSRTQQPLLRAFGAALRVLHARYEAARGREFSHDALANQLTARLRKFGPELSIRGSTLHRWEDGQVWSPAPLALRELAALYGTTYTVLITVLFRNAEQPDLPATEGLRLLEEATAHGTSDDSVGSLALPLPLDGFSATEAAARLITTSDELVSLAEHILHAASGGQTATVGRASPERRARNRTTG